MYFVVYLSALKKNVVLPVSWIHGIENHFEKFMNKSINSSQRFLCYYTTNDDAFVDGSPNEDYQPDFNSAVINEANADETFDGCFYGKLKQFKREYHFSIELKYSNWKIK